MAGAPRSRSVPAAALVFFCFDASAVQFDLDAFSEVFARNGLNCLAYDHRGFGGSDAAPGQPRQEIVPSLQLSDWSDAISEHLCPTLCFLADFQAAHAQSLDEVDPAKIGIWGSSYSGGHVIQLGASDKRVKYVNCPSPAL